MRIITTLTAVALLALAACSCSRTERVSFDQADQNRAIANDNSLFNAQKWRAENHYGDLEIMKRGDSTISRECPQGDGWATIDLAKQGTHEVQLKLKCSTASANIGCLEESDFKSKAYATQDGKCNDELTSPLQKLAQ